MYAQCISLINKDITFLNNLVSRYRDLQEYFLVYKGENIASPLGGVDKKKKKH